MIIFLQKALAFIGDQEKGAYKYYQSSKNRQAAYADSHTRLCISGTSVFSFGQTGKKNAQPRKDKNHSEKASYRKDRQNSHDQRKRGKSSVSLINRRIRCRFRFIDRRWGVWPVILSFVRVFHKCKTSFLSK